MVGLGRCWWDGKQNDGGCWHRVGYEMVGGRDTMAYAPEGAVAITQAKDAKAGGVGYG